jgi:hypothetical protein
MRRRLRRMAGLTQQLGQNGVGLRILRMRLEDCARRGERLVELTQGLKGSYLSVLSGDHAWGSRRRGAKGRSRLGAKTARLIETAKREVSPEEIRLQCDRVPIPGDRLFKISKRFESKAERHVRHRKGRVPPDGVGKRSDRLVWPPGGDQCGAEVTLHLRHSRVQAERPLQNGDRFDVTSPLHQADAVCSKTLGFALLCRRCSKRSWRRSNFALGAGAPCKEGLEIGMGEFIRNA